MTIHGRFVEKFWPALYPPGLSRTISRDTVERGDHKINWPIYKSNSTRGSPQIRGKRAGELEEREEAGE